MTKDLFTAKSSVFIKKEREKAKLLKQSSWWKQKIREGYCYHCHKKFPAQALTMDHLVPLVRGGKTGKNNVVVSCKTCNSKKSSKTLVELKLLNK